MIDKFNFDIFDEACIMCCVCLHEYFILKPSLIKIRKRGTNAICDRSIFSHFLCNKCSFMKPLQLIAFKIHTTFLWKKNIFFNFVECLEDVFSIWLIWFWVRNIRFVQLVSLVDSFLSFLKLYKQLSPI